MNLRKNGGITLVSLSIAMVILLILAGIAVNRIEINQNKTIAIMQFAELNKVQHAILERKVKVQLTNAELPGTTLTNEELTNLVTRFSTLNGGNFSLKGNNGDYKKLTTSDLEELGIENSKDEYVVNYKTGECINITKEISKTEDILYVY